MGQTPLQDLTGQMAKNNMGEFQPKGAEVLQQEILAELDVSYEGNEEMIDKMVARELKGEEFKASVHEQKKEHQAKSQKREELLKNLGVNPETGEKIATNVVKPDEQILSKKEQILEGRALNSLHEDDIEQVVRIAEANKVSLSEAVKDPYIKAFIKTREEERKTAEATITITARKSNSKTDEKALLEKASTGKLSQDEMREAAKVAIADAFGK